MPARGGAALGVLVASVAAAGLTSRCTCVGPSGFELLPPPARFDAGFEVFDGGGGEDDAGDAGFRSDGGRRDGGPRPDSGAVPDAGFRRDAEPRPDTGFVPDGGCEPQLEVTPPSVFFPTVRGEATITVRNVGCGLLEVTHTEMFAPPPNTEFFMVGCAPGCDRLIRLCNPTRLGCRDTEASFDVFYDNMDRTLTDSATLQITSNDPLNPIQLVQLSAERTCAPPTSIIALTTIDPVINVPVVLDGTASETGGPDIEIMTWQWYFVSQPGGASFSQPSSEVTSFTPFSPGIYVIGLRVTNDCNIPSPNDGFITLSVREPN